MEAFDSKKVSKEILVKLFIAKKVSKGSKKSQFQGVLFPCGLSLPIFFTNHLYSNFGFLNRPCVFVKTTTKTFHRATIAEFMDYCIQKLEQAKSSIKVDTLTLCEEEWGLKDQNME